MAGIRGFCVCLFSKKLSCIVGNQALWACSPTSMFNLSFKIYHLPAMLNLWARPNGKCNNHSIILWEWDWIVADLISVEFFCSASLFSAGLRLELKRAVETCWEINLYSWLFCGLLAHLTHNAMLSWIPSLYASILHSHLVNHVPKIYISSTHRQIKLPPAGLDPPPNTHSFAIQLCICRPKTKVPFLHIKLQLIV